MFKKPLLICLLAVSTYLMYGQEVFTGNVTDEKGTPLEYVSLALMTPSDSTIVRGVVTDASGTFTIPADKGQWLIWASLIGYESVYLHCNTDHPNLGTITLKEAALELGAITVTGERPGVKIIPDGLSFKPTPTELKLPDLVRYLEQMPFVEASERGFAVTGRGSAAIYLNNRRVEDISELKEYKPTDVLRVEIIPNPGPIYGADVMAVIKIRTKRRERGLGAELTSNISHSEKTDYWNQAKVSYNTSKLSFQNTLTYNYNPTADHVSIDQIMGKDRSSSVVYDTEEDQVYRGLNFRNSIVYTPTDRHSIGASLTYTHSSWHTDISNGLSYSGVDSKADFIQNSSTKTPDNRWMGNLFYNYTDERWDLLFNADLYRGSGTNTMTSLSSDHAAAEDLSTKSKDSNSLCYFQAVGQYKFTHRFSLQAGADYSYTNVSQSYDTDKQDIGLTSFDIGTEQHRYAAYTGLDYALDLLFFTAGLRYEGLHIEREDKTTSTKHKLFSTSKFYPSASISLSKGSFQAQASYSMKTNYPAYNQLRAGMSYSSPYLYEGGNPDLRPETRHEVSLLAQYRGTTLMAGFSKIRDEIIQLPELYGDHIMLYYPLNLGPNKYLSLAISQRLTWAKIVNSTLNANYMGQWLNVQGFTKKRGDAFSLTLNNTIPIGEHWLCFLNAGYTSSSKVSLYKLPQFWYLDAAVNVSLLSERVNIYFGCYDIFSTRHDKRDYRSEEIIMHYDRHYQTRTWSLTVSYTLPSFFKDKNYKGNTTNDEIRRL